MAFTIISDHTVGSQTLLAGDSIMIAQGVILAGDGNHAIQTTSDDVVVNVLGTVTIGNSLLAPIGIGVLNIQPDRASVFVGVSGSVIGLGGAVFMNDGVDNSIINHGQLQGRQDVIRVNGGEIDILNTGHITRTGNDTANSAIFLSAGNGGINSDNIRNVINAGTISAPGLPKSFTGPAAASNFTGTLFSLENSGSILVGGATAIYSSANFSEISNTGLIVGDIVLRMPGSVSNTGLIDGDIRLEYGPNVTNDLYFATGQGLVTGQITMGNGNDRAVLGDLGGLVLGDTGNDTLVGGEGSDTLWGGDDNDTLSGRGGEDELWGGSGLDRILGGEGNDLVNGEAGNDWLAGQGGDDTIDGGAGRDAIQGGGGDDMIDGGTDDDRLAGNAGDDTLAGDFGNDTIIGGGGEDALTGGPGRDVLRGGSDADEFIYLAANDSRTGATSDRIVDFGAGDVIDLTATSAQEITFVGTEAYLGNGAASVRYFTNTFGHSAVLVDVDGDGNSDMRIVMLNATGFAGGDFIL